MKVALDENRITRLDGRPFFLIGARHMPEGGTPEMLRDAGFNAFRRIAFGTETSAADPVPPRDLEGIYFWSYLFDRANLGRSPRYERELREWIEAVRSHPALLCYENYNEPTLVLHGAKSFKAQPEDLALGTRVVREIDPHHPIWMAHCCHNTVETLRRFGACADVVGCNPYPVFAPGMRRHVGMLADGRILDCPDQSIHAVGKYTDKMTSVAEGKPVWMLVQALANENWFNLIHTPEMAGQSLDESKILYPTYEQMRFMAFDAIVSGATGLALSMHKTPAAGRVWADIQRLVGELRDLHDALALPPLPGRIEIEYSDLGHTIWDGVRVLARRKGNEIFVFAVNTAADPAEVTLRMPVGVMGGAVVEGESREVGIDRHTFHDHFSPFEVHVYRLLAAEKPFTPHTAAFRQAVSHR